MTFCPGRWVPVVLLMTVASAALGEEPKEAAPEGSSATGEEQEAEHRLHAGVAASAWVGIADGQSVGRYGGGAFLAISIVPHRLELTPFVRVLGSKEGTVVPLDLLLEVPFHLTQAIHPFVALGPTVAPTFSGDGTRVAWGGASVLGVHLYVSKEYAILLEANYNLLDADGTLENEVGASVGALIAF